MSMDFSVKLSIRVLLAAGSILIAAFQPALGSGYQFQDRLSSDLAIIEPADEGWVDLPLSQWTLANDASRDGASIVLGTYGAADYDNLFLQVSEIVVNTTPDWDNLGLNCYIYYDDGNEESLSAIGGAANTPVDLHFQPVYWQGRRIAKIHLGHGGSWVHHRLNSVKVYDQGPTILFDFNDLGSITLDPKGNLQNDLLFIPAHQARQDWITLTNVNTRYFRMVANRNLLDYDSDPEPSLQITVTLIDSSYKSVYIEIGKDVAEYSVDLGTDPDSIARVELSCGATALVFIIRKLEVLTGQDGELGPYEPNDYYEDAYGPLVNGQTYEAYLEDTLDVDWYYFVVGEETVLASASAGEKEVPEFVLNKQKNLPVKGKVKAPNVKSPLLGGASCTVELTSLPGDYDLQFFDETSEEAIAISEESDTADEQITLSDLPEGTYWVAVYSMGYCSTTDSYLLTVSWEIEEETLAPGCDFNGDGKINITDVIALLLHQRANPGNLKTDFNQDGKANITDAIAMLLAMRDGTCPDALLQLASAAAENNYLQVDGLESLSQEEVQYLEEMTAVLRFTPEEKAAVDLAVYGRGGRATLPKAFSLSQNTPNPFNPSTVIGFTVPESAGGVQVSLRVYNLHGQLVRVLVHESRSPGSYSVMWDGADESGRQVASGVYFYRMTAGDFTGTRKMVLLK